MWKSIDDGDDIIDAARTGRPPLRVWELQDNSTRYEQLLAAPSDDTLVTMWTAWTVIALLVGIFVSIIFIAIVSSREARKYSFNIYLLSIMIPDIVFSLCCGITCLINATQRQYYAPWMCAFQQWYCVFGIGSNAWLNAVITYQLHTMLVYSGRVGHTRRRYIPPTRRSILVQASIVYIYVGFLGTWGLFFQPIGALSGLACLPIDAGRNSAIFFWLVYVPLFVGIPTVYVFYAGTHIVYAKLLPPSGKRRSLAIYFGRLCLVFIIMWIPTFIILFFVREWLSPWANWVGGTWSHLQGAVSAAISLLKPDIWQATKEFLTCRCNQTNGYEENPSSSNWELASFRFSSLRSLTRFPSTRSGVSMNALPLEQRPSMNRREQSQSVQSLYSNNSQLSFNGLGGAGVESLNTVQDDEDESMQSSMHRDSESASSSAVAIVEQLETIITAPHEDLCDDPEKLRGHSSESSNLSLNVIDSETANLESLDFDDGSGVIQTTTTEQRVV